MKRNYNVEKLGMKAVWDLAYLALRLILADVNSLMIHLKKQDIFAYDAYLIHFDQQNAQQLSLGYKYLYSLYLLPIFRLVFCQPFWIVLLLFDFVDFVEFVEMSSIWNDRKLINFILNTQSWILCFFSMYLVLFYKKLTSQRDRGATSSVPEPGEVWLILLLHPGDPGIIPCWPPPIGDFIACINTKWWN